VITRRKLRNSAPAAGDAGTAAGRLLTIVDTTMLTILGSLTVVVTGLQLFALWAGWPVVELTPDGIRVLGPFGFIAMPCKRSGRAFRRAPPCARVRWP
jgi:hypothetical protein